jgi:SAM-dependent methyltransferase
MADRSTVARFLKTLASDVRARITRRDAFAPFLAQGALRINYARQQHLATLALPIDGQRVLEVGAGIGLHTAFFEARGCDVVVTDAREENVLEIRRRFPHRRAEILDVERPETYSTHDHFDIIYCYGLLYHLSNPERALDGLATLGDVLLLETRVTPGSADSITLFREHTATDQALRQIGCRPTRRWVLEALRSRWGYAYTTRTQPGHPEFPTDWRTVSADERNTSRAIFVASRRPLDSPHLSEEILDVQSPSSGAGS